MNDIEKLIARLPRPSPSPELDARISELTNRAGQGAGARARLRRFGVLAACTACGGLMGFVLGRQSVVPVTEIHAVAIAPAAQFSSPGPARERAMVNVHLPQNEALARFVMPPKRLEGLFGRIPLDDQSRPSQFE